MFWDWEDRMVTHHITSNEVDADGKGGKFTVQVGFTSFVSPFSFKWRYGKRLFGLLGCDSNKIHVYQLHECISTLGKYKAQYEHIYVLDAKFKVSKEYNLHGSQSVVIEHIKKTIANIEIENILSE